MPPSGFTPAPATNCDTARPADRFIMRTLDPTRAELFLAELRRSGNAHKAAIAASPGRTGARPGHSTFWEARRREPAFRAAWDAALADFRARQRRLKQLALAVVDLAEVPA